MHPFPPDQIFLVILSPTVFSFFSSIHLRTFYFLSTSFHFTTHHLSLYTSFLFSSSLFILSGFRLLLTTWSTHLVYLIHLLSIHFSIPPSTDQVLLFFVPSLHSSNFLTFMTFPSYKATDKSSHTSFSSSSIHFSFLSLRSVCVYVHTRGPHALQQLQPIPLARWAGLQWRGKHNDNTSVSRTHSSLAATAPALTLRLVPPFIHHSWERDFFFSFSWESGQCTLKAGRRIYHFMSVYLGMIKRTICTYVWSWVIQTSETLPAEVYGF